MEKYQAQTASSSYLFPFLVDDGNKRQDKTIDKMQEEARLYHNAEARISYHLRKLGTKIGSRASLPSISPAIPGQRRQETMMSLSPLSARHWDIIPKPPHKSISAPSKAQKWMMPTPRYWQPYEPQKRIKRGFSKNEPK